MINDNKNQKEENNKSNSMKINYNNEDLLISNSEFIGNNNRYSVLLEPFDVNEINNNKNNNEIDKNRINIKNSLINIENRKTEKNVKKLN